MKVLILTNKSDGRFITMLDGNKDIRSEFQRFLDKFSNKLDEIYDLDLHELCDFHCDDTTITLWGDNGMLEINIEEFSNF